MRKTFLVATLASLLSMQANAEENKITSPDGKLVVTVNDDGGQPTYVVDYDGVRMMTRSMLGLVSSHGDFSQGLKLKGVERKDKVTKEYDLTRSKISHIKYVSSKLDLNYENADGKGMTISFSVADNSIAYRYTLHRPKKDPIGVYIKEEKSSFNFPEQTTTFLTPQCKPRWGFAATKPSYEEDYEVDQPIDKPSRFGEGYTFPALFRIGNDGWALVSETGTTSEYCGCRLSDYNKDGGYRVAFPQQGENNGIGSVEPALGLPASTPWRTITLGKTLEPIAETTMQFDVLDPLYKAKYDYKPGRYTWSWILWGDGATRYNEQVQFIDLAATMGYEYCLVDALWDTQIGYDKVEELSRYAQSKGVHLLLWYNSNGAANDAPQGPRNIMNNPIRRKQEMAWMQKHGVKGIKVDFFGGDKQETMRLYEEILVDANDYGLQVIFHGCTLPRGWERMYPNFVGSEGALASENLNFMESHAKSEGFEMSLHPFIRNAVGAFDWGGVFLNKYFSRDNKSRHPRYSSDIFELATAITNQCSVNCMALTPNNLTDAPQLSLDLARMMPTTWTKTEFIDGYPGKYAILARENSGKWYVGGINGTDKKMKLTLSLPMFAGKKVTYYFDNPRKEGEIVPEPAKKTLSVDKKGMATVTIQPMGGIIITE